MKRFCAAAMLLGALAICRGAAEEDMRQRFVTEQEFLGRRVPVSDIRQFTSSSNPISCFDPERKVIFAPYHAARNAYGEQCSVFALAEIPVNDPKAARNFVLLESDAEFQGRRYRWPVDTFAVMHDGRPRIFFLANSNEYFFFDWSPEERRIAGEIAPVMCRIGNRTEPLTAAAVDAYLKANGCTGYNLDRDPREKIIATAKPARVGNVFYGTVTSGMSQPILFRCADGKTFEFLSVIPKIAQYECQIAVHRNKVCALLRGASGDNFYVAEVGKWRFSPRGRLPLAETRPQFMVWNDRLLIGYSRNGIKPNRVREGRNNLIVLVGDWEDLKNFTEVFRAVDELGIVSYDLVDCDGELFAIWSNSERFPDKPMWNGLHGKDALFGSFLTKKTDNLEHKEQTK